MDPQSGSLHEVPAEETGIPIRQSTAQNVTASFRTAASGMLGFYRMRRSLTDERSALETGQLVKDAYFTLFEAVGALEVRTSLPCTSSGGLKADIGELVIDHGP